MSDERNTDLVKENLMDREENLITPSTLDAGNPTPRPFSKVDEMSLEPHTRETGVSKGPQNMIIYQQDNGQIWAIIGCVLTIGNIIAALVIYTYKRRKRRLRQRGRTRNAGSVPSDSHYTLPTNADPHYLQIMDNPEGTSAGKRRNSDDDGYLTAIERNSEKNSGYTDIVHFSSSQRSNSYQEISEVNELSLVAHLPVLGTRSLDPPMRIHKRREKYLVNINIPSDPLEESVRKSCVLSPELMDEGLFESLNNFTKYFTSLSVKKKKENCDEDDDIIEDENDVKETKFEQHRMKNTEDKTSDMCSKIDDEDNIHHDDINNTRESQKEAQQCYGNLPIFNAVEHEEQYVKKKEELPVDVPVEQSVSHSKQLQDRTGLNEKLRTHVSTDFDQSSVSSRGVLYNEKVGMVSLPNKECIENRKTLKDTERIDNKDGNQTYAFSAGKANNLCKEPDGINDNLPLKKSRGLLLAPMSSFNSDHSLNNYIRKNGILLPVKIAADDNSVADNSYKRDTL